MTEEKMYVWIVGFIVLGVMSVVGGLTIYNMQDIQVQQKKMTACVQAGNIWVQNSNREMECRKG